MPSTMQDEGPARAEGMGPLVSVIMAVHDAGPYIGAAIGSVLGQTHTRWELLIGCDGCTDDTVSIARSFDDPRIHVFEAPRQGVSVTRNSLIDRAGGGILCFLDGDDVLPPRSLAARLEVLARDPGVSFVDGAVEFRDGDLARVVGHYRPRFRGFPLPWLLVHDGRCFFGNTWMIRREPGVAYRFDAELTHGEDLFFYITIAEGRRYDHVDEVVLWYRRTGGSAMADLERLEQGYVTLYRKINALHRLRPAQRRRLKLFMLRVMALAYLKYRGSPAAALRVTGRYLLL